MRYKSPMRLRPIHGIIVVVLVIAGTVAAQYFFEGGAAKASYIQVRPDAQGGLAIEAADLAAGNVRYYRFLNHANQEIDFFVGRDAGGGIQVGFDASEVCMKKRRGFRHEGEWMVCNFCDKAFHLKDVNADGGGCAPVALKHSVQGSRVLLTENDVLAGWRLFH
jgi:uncharacterized membrane protein